MSDWVQIPAWQLPDCVISTKSKYVLCLTFLIDKMGPSPKCKGWLEGLNKLIFSHLFKYYVSDKTYHCGMLESKGHVLAVNSKYTGWNGFFKIKR